MHSVIVSRDFIKKSSFCVRMGHLDTRGPDLTSKHGCIRPRNSRRNLVNDKLSRFSMKCYVSEREFFNFVKSQIFTALHAMQTRSSDENSVRLSVCLSVRLSHAWIVTKR